ncbi:MAG: hypothetical protein WAM39_32520, partial [Bryobacteraceae bacterium]
LDGNITEMTVTFDPMRRQWRAVYPTPSAFSRTASFSVASDLPGPWTPARAFFSYPEMQKGDPRYTSNVFCYAAKEHPELEAANQLAFTYACNSTGELEVLKDLRLYRPELVKLQRVPK